MQNTIDTIRSQNSIPALQVCVYQSSENNYCGTSGIFQNDKRKGVLLNDHLFRVGSVTKLYTSTVIQILINQGKLHLNDPISTWFPDIDKSDIITVENLLWQTSGIPDYVNTVSFRIKAVFPFTNWDPSELAKMVCNKKLLFNPDDRFSYSNSNYLLLGIIAEKVTGRNFVDLFHDYIVKPLGLQKTLFPPYDTLSPEVISGYEKLLSFRLSHDWDHVSWSSGAFTAGAVTTNACELSKFVQLLFEGNILSHDTIGRVTQFKKHLDKDNSAWTGYGAGISRFDIDGVTWWGHEGLFIGFGGIVLYNPQQRYTIALIANTTSFDKIDAIRKIQKALSNDVFTFTQ